MSSRRAVVPPSWSDFYEATHIPAAVRIGSTLRLTGHTGDAAGSFSPDLEAQIRQTFSNIGETLAAAGSSWGDVIEMVSYHVGLREQADVLLRIAAEFLDDPYPAWSAVGVTQLFEPEALVEISLRRVHGRPGGLTATTSSPGHAPTPAAAARRRIGGDATSR